MSFATKRVIKDHNALRKQPLAGIAAVPREENVNVWDAGILVEVPQLPATLMHVGIEFTNEYPFMPPNAGFGVLFSSSHYGASDTIPSGPLSGMHTVCLNIVGNFSNIHTEWATTKGEGWSPSLSASTLLVNLQYLITSSIAEYPHKAKKLHADCEAYLRSHKLPEAIMALLHDKTGDVEKKEEDGKMEKVETEQQPPAAAVVAVVPEVDAAKEAERRRLDAEITCWYSCIHYSEGILGFGVKIEPQGRKKVLSTDGEYISYDAYLTEGLRQFVNKDSFDLFLPIWINQQHTELNERWLPTMMRCIQQFQCAVGMGQQQTIIFVFCDLMNTMTVKMMDQRSDTKASLKIFSSIVNIWRCFYFLSFHIREVRTTILTTVQQFISDPKTRRKETTPNVGWLLSMASILHKGLELDWNAFMIAFEEETALRRVMWWQKDHVDLNDPQATYRASNISRKNSLFQCLFQQVVVEGTAGGTLDETLERMDRSGCRMVEEMETLLASWKDIEQQCDAPTASWVTHYQLMGRFGIPAGYLAQHFGTVAIAQTTLQRIIGKANGMQGYFWASPAHGGGRGGYSGGGRGSYQGGNNGGRGAGGNNQGRGGWGGGGRGGYR
jgi:ubiquitin-protein ligase